MFALIRHSAELLGMEFEFEAEIWRWPGNAAWHFVSLPLDVADAIDFLTADVRRGFGSVRVTVTSDGVQWSTSVFPDKKSGTYVLPVKQAVRKQLGVEAGSRIRASLRVDDVLS